MTKSGSGATTGTSTGAGAGVTRVMGIETEYGISVPGHPGANPMVLSGRVVQSYPPVSGRQGRPVGWDYADETPLADARGFALARMDAHPTQLTDEGWSDPTIANAVLTNGARLYVDHAHPEYSSPEFRTPREGLLWDRAGEIVMAQASAALSAGLPHPVHLYKNNTDGKGASYGTHENYLVPREVPFDRIVAGLIPFFVTRQLICGAGRVGIGQKSEQPGFQISSRADFFEAEVGLETTFRRPIVNTRDEPHALAEKYRRLHVIIGDANLADVAGLLKLGMTSLVLRLIEADAVPRELTLAHPLAALRQISQDPGCTALIELADGRRLTGLDVLEGYRDAVASLVEDRGGDAAGSSGVGAGHRSGDADADGDADATVEVMTWWTRVLDTLRTDPLQTSSWLDWTAKLALLEGFRQRDGLGWDAPRLQAIDIQYSDARPGKGLARALEAKGRLTRLVDDTEIEAAVVGPPETTRAYFRGECVRRYPQNVVSASWDSVVFSLPGESTLQRVGLLEPTRGTADLVADIFAASPDAATLLEHLSAAR